MPVATEATLARAVSATPIGDTIFAKESKQNFAAFLKLHQLGGVLQDTISKFLYIEEHE